MAVFADVFSVGKSVSIPCEQRFLSCMAFSVSGESRSCVLSVGLSVA